MYRKLSAVRDRWDLLHACLLRRKPRQSEASTLLVVCKGNICRSPYAEQKLRAALPGWQVRSGGLDTTPGKPANPSAQAEAARRGINLEHHRTHSVSAADLIWGALIVVMEPKHLIQVLRRDPSAPVALLGHFLKPRRDRIADPYGKSAAVFAENFDLLDQSVEGLKEFLLARKGAR